MLDNKFKGSKNHKISWDLNQTPPTCKLSLALEILKLSTKGKDFLFKHSLLSLWYTLKILHKNTIKTHEIGH